MRCCHIGILVFLLMFFTSAFALKSSPTAAFPEAVSLYKSGKYGEAAEAFEKIAQTGLQNGRLFYNLGNAYTQIGKAEQAAEAYAVAAQLAPRDAQIASRLGHTSIPLNVNEMALIALLAASALSLALVGSRHGLFSRRLA